MNKEYLDIIFKAIDLKDIELLVFVLSKDINKDIFKSLAKINYKDNKNVYEYLLVNKENEMLDAFVRFGFWAHINLPITSNNDTLIELAYRYKNLPIIIAILKNDNIDYSSKDEVFKTLLKNIKTDYQISSYLLFYINQNIETVDYPIELNENNFHEALHTSITDNNGFDISSLSYNKENIENKVNKAISKLKSLFNYNSEKENSVNISEDFNKIETGTEHSEEMKNDKSSYHNSYLKLTPEEIKSKIKQNRENDNIKNLMNEIEDHVITKKSNDREDFSEQHDRNFKTEKGFLKDLTQDDFSNGKDKIELVIKHLLIALSDMNLKRYATIKNFISLLNDYEIETIPKIEQDTVSSFDFEINNKVYPLSLFNEITMKEIRDVLEINKEDNMYLINEKINYLKRHNILNKEYLRLFITRSFFESKNLIDFLLKIRHEKINLEINIKDFNLDEQNKESLESVQNSLMVYFYNKENIKIEDKELPEMIQFSNIKKNLLR